MTAPHLPSSRIILPYYNVALYITITTIIMSRPADDTLRPVEPRGSRMPAARREFTTSRRSLQRFHLSMSLYTLRLASQYNRYPMGITNGVLGEYRLWEGKKGGGGTPYTEQAQALCRERERASRHLLTTVAASGRKREVNEGSTQTNSCGRKEGWQRWGWWHVREALVVRVQIGSR